MSSSGTPIRLSSRADRQIVVADDGIALRKPRVEDGSKIWRLARDSNALEVNSQYIYTLWCRDFIHTTAVAEDHGAVCGFIIAYARPSRSDTLFIWQAAVDQQHRGRRLAVRMLEFIVGDRYEFVECTVTASNKSSESFLTAFAKSRSAAIERSPLFGSDLFPDKDHEPEELFRAGPIGARID